MRNGSPVFFLVAIVVFILDQVTKYLIKSYVGPFEVIRIFSFLNIIYAENTSSAFGLFKSLGNSFFVIVAIVAMVTVSVLIVKDKANRLVFSFILGGALGNVADRIIHGYVVDFLDFYVGNYHWPAFNVADSFLTIGIALLVIKTVFYAKKA